MSDTLPIVAIVDFADDDGTAPRRRVFSKPVSVHVASTLSEVVPTVDAVERLARAGHWVVGFVAYEASPAFDPALATAPAGPLPLAWFATFDAPRTDAVAPRDVTSVSPEASAADPLSLTSGVSDRRYADAITRIHELIEAGDVYQVNLTVPFTGATDRPPLELYERMRLAQGGRYGAYLDIGDTRVLSASPELFFERRGTVVRTRPMKGTMRRGLHAESDIAARDALRASEKDRAENVMIVDVARNDLGRVACLGTVRVSELFTAERYPSVWQLTSTVEADVHRDVTLSVLFRALFPPASITGAPKIRASQAIAELEGAPRGVYCGAIGLLRPGGDAVFSVAIRTATTRDGVLRVDAGGGVTIDSTATGEMAEVRDKLTAFTAPRPRPALFETIRVERGTPLRLARHLARLAASADYFDLPFDATQAETLAREAAAAWTGDVGRMRLVLQPDGLLDVKVEPFGDTDYDARGDRPGSSSALPVVCASMPVDRRDIWLHHKTAFRSRYDDAMRNAPDVFDVVLWNREGEVTELTRGNLVVELDGTRYTPPLDCGLLAGTLRAELLDSGRIHERVVRLRDLSRATRLWFVNALRGWVPVRLAEDPPAPPA
ncbi:MAG TPA: aminodeoxychorismate synthase component I [Gemmatimonadaceae bacterium]